MSSLEDLYQSKILEFARMARGINLLTDPTVSFTSKNPVCGDEVTIDLIINVTLLQWLKFSAARRNNTLIN